MIIRLLLCRPLRKKPLMEKIQDFVLYILIRNYNHFATTNTIWSTIHNVTTGRMALHRHPVALKLNLKSVPKKVSGKKFKMRRVCHKYNLSLLNEKSLLEY